MAATGMILTAACSAGTGGGEDGEDGALVTLEGPRVRIGAVDDPDFAFGTVVDLAIGPDGTAYSVHRGDAHVRLWSPSGEPAGVIGGEGQGPGEFTRPGKLGFFGDTLWVMDTYAYRVSHFDPSGTFLGSVVPEVDLGSAASEAEWSPPRPRTPLRDGTFVGEAPAWSDDIARGTLTRTPFVHMDGQGGTVGSIWMRPWRSTDILAILNEDAGGFFMQQPYGDDPLVEVTGDGIVVTDRRAWAGQGRPSLSVTRIDLRGDTVWSTSIPYEPAPLVEARVDSAARSMARESFDFWSRNRSGASLGAFERDVREATYAPAWAPPARSLVVAEDGSTWIERFESVRADDGELLRAWWIVGPDGARRGSALTPDGLRILVLTEDAAWGVETDELDVNYIVRYELLRTDAT